MKVPIEWVVCGVNLLLRLTLLKWELPRDRLPIPKEQQNEAFETFSAHGARQVAVTWPLLALVGILSESEKQHMGLTGVGTLVGLFAISVLTAALVRISHDRFRPGGIPFVVVAATTALDFAMTMWGNAAVVKLVAEKLP